MSWHSPAMHAPLHASPLRQCPSEQRSGAPLLQRRAPLRHTSSGRSSFSPETAWHPSAVSAQNTMKSSGLLATRAKKPMRLGGDGERQQQARKPSNARDFPGFRQSGTLQRVATPADLASDEADSVLGLVGETLGGRYRLERAVGRGATGAVFAVRDNAGHPYALKVVPEAIAGREGGARLLREAKLIATLKSRYVVNVSDVGRDERCRVIYLAMPLIHGQSLA